MNLKRGETLCPACSADLVRHGTFVRGKSRVRVQRYKCKNCGAFLCEHTPHRIQREKAAKVIKAILDGHSLRRCSRDNGVHTHTVLRLVEVHSLHEFVNYKRNQGTPVTEKKKAYFEKYYREKTWVNQSDRQIRNNTLRAEVALLLAQSKAPLTTKQIYHSMLHKYPDLKHCALSLMLKRNADHFFKEDKGKYTYFPFYIMFEPTRPTKWWQFREIWFKARAAYFDRLGIRDEEAERAIKRALEQQADFLLTHRIEIAEKSRPFFKMMNAASQLTTALTK